MTGTVSDLVARLATDADFLDRKIMHGTAPAIARDIREAAKALTRLEQERDEAVIRQAHAEATRFRVWLYWNHWAAYPARAVNRAAGRALLRALEARDG